MILKRFGDARKVRQYLTQRSREILHSSVLSEHSLLPCLCARSPGDSLDPSSLPRKGWKRIGRWHAFPNIRSNFWLRSSLRLPPRTAADAEFFVLLQCGTTTESLIFVNGRKVSGVGNGMWGDIIPIRIPPSLRPGDRIEVLVNLFTGSTWDPGQNQLPQILQNFCVQEISSRGADLHYGFHVALEALKSLGPDDPHAYAILSALVEAWKSVDFSSQKAFLASVARPLDLLRDRVYGRGSSLPVTCTVFGHAHIDTAWLWPLRVTRQKCIRTFATQFRLLEDYPNWVFQQGQAQLYEFLSQNEPAMYRRVKTLVRKKRWEPSGGCWVEFDTNLSGAEALVRQVLYGREFFRREFGVTNTVLWLPDTFGYSGNLPQILAKSGIRLFMTTKLSWNDTTRHPHDTFLWKGIDGTSLLTHFVTAPSDWSPDGDSPGIHSYNTTAQPRDIHATWLDYQEKEINAELAVPFGYGDGGGGPHEDMVNRLVWMARGLPGFPKVRFGGLEDFRLRLERSLRGRDIPVYDNEMYLQFHRGVLTTQADIKKNNRKAEFALRFLDMFVLFSPERKSLFASVKKLWKTVLLNQFHDILPGSSVAPVYEESRMQFASLFAETKKTVRQVCSAFLRPDGFSVFNPYSWPFTGYVRVPSGRKVFVDRLPALGFTPLSDRPGKKPRKKTVSGVLAMENDSLSFRVDTATGRLAEVRLKPSGRRMDLDGRFNTLVAYEDTGNAWDILYLHRAKPVATDGRVLSAVLEDDGESSRLVLTKQILGSTVHQTIAVRRRDPVVTFETIIDWREDRCLLKAIFPVAVRSRFATYDIQFGAIERPTHENEPADAAVFEAAGHKWIDCSDRSGGVSILSDSKYGYSVKNGVMSISLLRATTGPDPRADRHRHEFSYGLYCHKGPWQDSEITKLGYAFNFPPPVLSGVPRDDIRPARLEIGYAEPRTRDDTLVLETLKLSEDRRGLVLRFYESRGTAGRTSIRFSWPGLDLGPGLLCDLEETELPGQKAGTAAGGTATIDFGPFEIVTVRFRILDRTDKGSRRSL